MPKTPFNSHKPGKEPKHKRCPPFEDAVNFYIENETDKNRALDFAGWLRKNKISPLSGTNGYNWYIDYKYIDYNNCKDGKYYRGTYHGCYIKLFSDTWHILLSKDILEQILLRDDLKKVLQNSRFPCYGCNYGCFKHTHKEICQRQPICLTNPDAETLDVLKDILLARKDSGDLEIKANMNIYNYGIIGGKI